MAASLLIGAQSHEELQVTASSLEAFLHSSCTQSDQADAHLIPSAGQQLVKGVLDRQVPCPHRECCSHVPCEQMPTCAGQIFTCSTSQVGSKGSRRQLLVYKAVMAKQVIPSPDLTAVLLQAMAIDNSSI